MYKKGEIVDSWCIDILFSHNQLKLIVVSSILQSHCGNQMIGIIIDNFSREIHFVKDVPLFWISTVFGVLALLDIINHQNVLVFFSHLSMKRKIQSYCDTDIWHWCFICSAYLKYTVILSLATKKRKGKLYKWIIMFGMLLESTCIILYYYHNFQFWKTIW